MLNIVDRYIDKNAAALTNTTAKGESSKRTLMC